jgi:hypothetical protein
VLAGEKNEKKYDFASPSLEFGGFDFSTPYYYGNETVGKYQWDQICTISYLQFIHSFLFVYTVMI